MKGGWICQIGVGLEVEVDVVTRDVRFSSHSRQHRSTVCSTTPIPISCFEIVCLSAVSDENQSNLFPFFGRKLKTKKKKLFSLWWKLSTLCMQIRGKQSEENQECRLPDWCLSVLQGTLTSPWVPHCPSVPSLLLVKTIKCDVCQIYNSPLCVSTLRAQAGVC